MRTNGPLAVPGPNVTGPVVKTLSTVAGAPIAKPSPTCAVPPPPPVASDGLTAGAPNFNITSAAASLSLPWPPPSRFSPGQLPPPPKDVGHKLATTQITDVPFIDSFQLIPEISEKDISGVQGWMKTDKEYEGVLKRMKERMTVEMNTMFGGAMWWEEGSPGIDVNGWKRGCEKFEVRYPDICGDKRKRRREGLKLPRKLEPEEADKPEELVPIRLDFDVGHHRMRDTFVWNLNDPVVTPDVFAQSIVDDYTLAPSYHPVIVKSIQEQLCDYRAHSFSYGQVSGELPAVDLRAQEGNTFRITTGSAGSKKKRKLSSPDATVKLKRKERSVCVFDMSMENNEGFKWPMAIDEIQLDGDLVHEELRVLIRLDIIVGAMRLEDQFEWDLESGTVTPEEFSKIYTQDLGLGGEFKTAIAHSIREQIQIYKKTLFLVGHPSDGTPTQDEELRQAFLPSLTMGARPMDQVPIYTPLLSTVSDGDIQQIEKKLQREMNRRRKRNQRGRSGIAIPGREPIRTHRTPANGFPEIDPATLALAAAANTSCSRRAAATAASLMIASIIASENDPTDIIITAPTSQATKEEKPKVLFKDPTVLPPVLVPLKDYPPPLNPPPPPSLEPKTKITLKNLAKELERTAMEKEFADGQYPNWIDGAWHCSNCGCPNSMTMSRRSGPLGEKSLCGLCGKFWHKHHRPRPVEYNPDPEFHTRQGSDSKTPAQYKATALRARRTLARPPQGQVQQALQKIPPVEDFQVVGLVPPLATETLPTKPSSRPSPIPFRTRPNTSPSPESQHHTYTPGPLDTYPPGPLDTYPPSRPFPPNTSPVLAVATQSQVPQPPSTTSAPSQPPPLSSSSSYDPSRYLHIGMDFGMNANLGMGMSMNLSGGAGTGSNEAGTRSANNDDPDRGMGLGGSSGVDFEDFTDDDFNFFDKPFVPVPAPPPQPELSTSSIIPLSASLQVTSPPLFGDVYHPGPGPNATEIHPMNPRNSPAHPGAGPMNVHRPSAISTSSLQRPPLPLKLDLSSASMRIASDEAPEIYSSGLVSPVTLTPRSARPVGPIELPEGWLFETPVDSPVIDLTLTGNDDQHQNNTRIDLTAGSLFDKPIELDLDMDADMNDLFSDDLDISWWSGGSPRLSSTPLEDLGAAPVPIKENTPPPPVALTAPLVTTSASGIRGLNNNIGTPRNGGDSKEFRDFWKPYMRTPFSGPPAPQLPPSLNSPNSNSSPQVISPPGLRRPYLASLSSSESLTLGAHQQQQQQQHDPNQGAPNGRPTWDGDFRSYEAAVLARKVPTTLNLAPKKIEYLVDYEDLARKVNHVPKGNHVPMSFEAAVRERKAFSRPKLDDVFMSSEDPVLKFPPKRNEVPMSFEAAVRERKAQTTFNLPQKTRQGGTIANPTP